MRILHAVHGYPPEQVGGTELYVQSLARRQVERGHDVLVAHGSLELRPRVEVVRGRDGSVECARIHRDDLYFDRWDKAHHPGVSLAFLDLLAEWRPDVVHVHHWIRLSSDLVRRARQAGARTVVSLHDQYVACPRVFRLPEGEAAFCEARPAPDPCVPCVPRWRFQDDDEVTEALAGFLEDARAELSAAQAVLAATPWHRRLLETVIPEPPRIAVEPLGRLESEVRPAPPSEDGLLRILVFGWVRPVKGVDVVIEALRLCAHRDRMELRVLGRCDDEDYLRRLRDRAAGLRVRFEGSYEAGDLSSEPVDVVCLPTRARETWSFALDEAVALGAPIVASDHGALRDRATERVALFPPGDAESLARELDRFAQEPERAARMRRATAPRVVPMEEHARRLGALYERLRAPKPADAVAARAGLETALAHFRRRERHFRELVRTEGWTDVVEQLRARVAELEDELRGS